SDLALAQSCPFLNVPDSARSPWTIHQGQPCAAPGPDQSNDSAKQSVQHSPVRKDFQPSLCPLADAFLPILTLHWPTAFREALLPQSWALTATVHSSHKFASLSPGGPKVQSRSPHTSHFPSNGRSGNAYRAHLSPAPAKSNATSPAETRPPARSRILPPGLPRLFRRGTHRCTSSASPLMCRK